MLNGTRIGPTRPRRQRLLSRSTGDRAGRALTAGTLEGGAELVVGSGAPVGVALLAEPFLPPPNPSGRLLRVLHALEGDALELQGRVLPAVEVIVQEPHPRLREIDRERIGRTAFLPVIARVSSTGG